MTAAFNLAQLANNVNTSGQLSVPTGITGTISVANGGTGQTSLTANNVLLGNGTSGLQTVAPGSNGNVLRSNGSTWQSQTITTVTATSGSAPYFGARAFVSWDATRNSSGGSDTLNTARFIYASQNVTSVVKTATGQFTVNFTTSMASSSYVVIGTVDGLPPGFAIVTKSTNSVTVASYQQGPGYYNTTQNDMVVFA